VSSPFSGFITIFYVSNPPVTVTAVFDRSIWREDRFIHCQMP
jgi:hypothetical protein